MQISPPVQITVPFATSGLKNTIPAATNNVTGNAGYDAGFGSINMTPKTAGGIPPFGQDFNGIFFDLTTAIQFLEAGGSFPYNSTFATAVGGYPIGAIVSRTDGTGLWRNTVPNNTTNPETFGAGWQPEDAGSTPITMTNANVTLTALQAARSIIIITGVLTANLSLIFPTYAKQWLVINSCTGAFTITAKTAAGSGVVLATGIGSQVYGDGTNISAFAGIKGISRFSSAGTFVVPSGISTIYVSATAGGGGGGSGGGSTASASNYGGGAGGGGAGQNIVYQAFSVTPGQSIAITVGGGGGGGGASVGTGATGVTGGNTVIGSLITLTGGTGGVLGNSLTTGFIAGGNGGAGFPAGSAGSDGQSGSSSADGGPGGSNPFGGGGGGGRGANGAGIAGSAAFGFGGGGGGGGGSYIPNSGSSGAGGAGAPGLVIIEW